MRSSCCIAFLVLSVAGCAVPRDIPTPGESMMLDFDSSSPYFELEPVATVRDGRSGIDVYVSIPHPSLIFVQAEGGYEARYELLTRVRPRQSRDWLYSESHEDTAFVQTYEATTSPDRILHQTRIPLSEGAYDVEVTLSVAGEDEPAVRQREIEVFDAVGANMSEIQLRMQREGGSFEPVLSVHVPSGYDSLRTLTELYNMTGVAEARLALVRFVSDSSTATPPFWFTPGPGSLSYTGIDFRHGDTLQISRRRIRDAAETAVNEFTLPELDRGNYAAVLSLTVDGEERTKRKYFSVKRADFPRVTTIRQMAEALVYIARPDELEHILSAPAAPQMKERFDTFWAERMPNREAALSLLQSYYSRVEEANMLFSNHKEGWKTDPGMIYIVFGPPAYTERQAFRHDWYYFERGIALNQRLPPFIFRRATAFGFAGLFENYILQRARAYEVHWMRRVEKWREGVPL